MMSSVEDGESRDSQKGRLLPIEMLDQLITGEEDRERLRKAREQLAESRKLYSNAAGDPTLRQSFAVYLDALGTREAMRAFDDELLRELVTDLDYLRWIVHNDAWQVDSQRFLSFSDNVAVGYPTGPPEDLSANLGTLVGSISEYQMITTTMRRRFLRGGIALGSLYMDDRIVVGPALVDAVALEEEVAIYPRVVFSDACKIVILSDLQYGESPWQTQVLVDADGSIFINYLASALSYGDDLAPMRSVLEDHKEVVEQALATFDVPSRIREKCKWVADYHNFFASEVFEAEDEFLIDAALHPIERLIPRRFQLLPSMEDSEKG